MINIFNMFQRALRVAFLEAERAWDLRPTLIQRYNMQQHVQVSSIRPPSDKDKFVVEKPQCHIQLAKNHVCCSFTQFSDVVVLCFDGIET